MIALAPIVITASVLTIILQIVLIIIVLDTKKKTTPDSKEKIQSAAAAPEIRDARKPREHENRFGNRRPPFDQRVKPSPASTSPAPSQNVDPVERSLRDINLRLKNAERDQEKERRRIKDTIANPPQKRNDFNKPRDRNEGFRRNDRPRQDFAQQRPPEPPRPMREALPPAMPPAMPAAIAFGEPREIKTPPPAMQTPPQPQTPPSPPPAPAQPIVKQAEPVFEMDDSNAIDKENLQHGRKVMVKRRVLKAEDELSEDPGKNVDKPLNVPSVPEQTASVNPSEFKSSNETKPAIDLSISPEVSPDEPISFGR
jgi:hypothetical protein